MPDHPHSPDPDKLRALAEAAIATDRASDTVEFWDAANPTAILALLDRLREAERFVESCARQNIDGDRDFDSFVEEHGDDFEPDWEGAFESIVRDARRLRAFPKA